MSTSWNGHVNNWRTVLIIPLREADTTAVVGSLTNAPSTPFRASLYDASAYPNPADAEAVGQLERVIVTSVSDNLASITRGQEGTSAQAFVAGVTVANFFTALDLADIQVAVNALEPLPQDIQDSALTFSSATGANTYAIALTPAVTAYTTGQRFQFLPAATNTGTSTLNVNTVGAVTINKWSGGSLAALALGDIVAGQICDVVYDGTQFQILSGLGNGSAPSDSFTGYRSAVDISTPLAKWTESARFVTLWDGSIPLLFSSVSVTGNTAASGVNGLDTGSLAANTLYYRHLIGKANGTVSCLISLSATTPTLPSGYTLFRPVGWLVTDGSSYIIPYHQEDNWLWYYWGASAFVDGGTNAIAFVYGTTTDNSSHTVNLTSALSFPLIGTAMCRRVALSATVNGSGKYQISLWPTDSPNTGYSESILSNTCDTGTTAEIGVDSSGQFSYHNYGDTGQTCYMSIRGAQIEWF